MNPYLVFAGSKYYPGGGWDDFVGRFHTLDAAQKSAERAMRKAYDDNPGSEAWSHVVNDEVGRIVLRGEFDCTPTYKELIWVNAEEVNAAEGDRK